MINIPTNNRLFTSPIGSLTPQTLARQLDEFHFGHLFNIARTFEAIEQRDDILKGVAGKRKKSPARLPWQVLTTSDDPQAAEQRAAVEKMINTLDVRAAHDKSLRGGLPLLIEQIMDAVGKRYSCHELRFDINLDGSPMARLQFVPLWFFRIVEGAMNFVDAQGNLVPLNENEWLLAVGEGLMEATSIAYLYKHMPLRDWLLYCERNGSPGVKGTTDALPGTPEWNAAQAAVEAFGGEFKALLSRGANIEAIDLTTKGTLPYPQLVERMDKAIVALWRGSDMTTISSSHTGVSLQKNEAQLIEEHDCYFVADTLNTQLIAPFIRHVFGPAETVKVKINIQPSVQLDREVAVFTLLKDLGLPIPAQTVYQRLGLPTPVSFLQPKETKTEESIGSDLKTNDGTTALKII